MNEAVVLGKEKALEIKLPFDEVELIKENKDFIFENMKGVKEIRVIHADDESLQADGHKKPLPGKPVILF